MLFTSPRFVLMFVFIVCAVLGVDGARAAALFTIKDVKVDVTSENAYTAREEAFEEAQLEAFTRLVRRLAPSEAGRWARDEIDPMDVAAMIKDYELLDEKISNVRYIGTYTFRFKSAAVKQYFSGRSMTYSDLESEPVMILPFYQMGGRYDLWSYGNRWKQAWDRSTSQRSLVPIVVPVGDLQDVSDLRDDQALSYDDAKLRQLVARYGAKEAVIAVAVPDSGLLQGLQNGDVSQGALVVTLYRTDERAPQQAAQFYVEAEGRVRTFDALLDAAVKRVKGMLRDNWKAQTMVSAGRLNLIQLRIGVADLASWVKLEQKLRAVSAVRDVQLNSMTMGRAVVDLTFEGDLSRLQLALGRQNLKLAHLDAAVTDVDVQKDLPMFALVK